MKRKSFLLSLTVLFAAVVMCFAEDAFNGTWKLNEAKSKFTPETQKNTTVVYEAAGDSVKITVDGIDGQGNPVHSEWTGMYDGKDYPVTGDPASDTRSYKKINDHTLTWTQKKDGKVTSTGKVVLSADGKIRTVTVKGKTASGKKFSNTAVYDKQ